MEDYTKIRNTLANHRTQQSISSQISFIFATIQFEQVLLCQFLPSVVFEIIRKKFMCKRKAILWASLSYGCQGNHFTWWSICPVCLYRFVLNSQRRGQRDVGGGSPWKTLGKKGKPRTSVKENLDNLFLLPWNWKKLRNEWLCLVILKTEQNGIYFSIAKWQNQVRPPGFSCYAMKAKVQLTHWQAKPLPTFFPPLNCLSIKKHARMKWTSGF